MQRQSDCCLKSTFNESSSENELSSSLLCATRKSYENDRAISDFDGGNATSSIFRTTVRSRKRYRAISESDSEYELPSMQRKNKLRKKNSVAFESDCEKNKSRKSKVVSESNSENGPSSSRRWINGSRKKKLADEPDSESCATASRQCYKTLTLQDRKVQFRDTTPVHRIARERCLVKNSRQDLYDAKEEGRPRRSHRQEINYNENDPSDDENMTNIKSRSRLRKCPR